MATLLVLHVIAIGIVLNRFPLRSYTFLGCFLYFFGFYVGVGHYISDNRKAITPVMPLEDDYYNYYRPKKTSPFDPSNGSKKEASEEEKEMEENIRFQKRRLDESKGHPSTKP